MPKQRWEDVDQYMHYQKPNTDRSTFTKSNEWAFGSSSFKKGDWPKKQFDESKCKTCGGRGTVENIREDRRGKRRGIKRITSCPEECEYTVKW